MLPCQSQLCRSRRQGAVLIQDAGDPDRQGSVCKQPGQAAQPLRCNVILEDVSLVCQLLLQLVLPLPAKSYANDTSAFSGPAFQSCCRRPPSMKELDRPAASLMKHEAGGLS